MYTCCCQLKKSLLRFTAERRRRWISAISREDLTDSILENDRDCNKNFLSGEPVKDWYRVTMLRGLVAYFLSWAFHCKQQVQVKDPEEAEGRSRRRAAERRKRRSELLENAIKDKMQKIDELGETIEEIGGGGAG